MCRYSFEDLSLGDRNLDKYVSPSRSVGVYEVESKCLQVNGRERNACSTESAGEGHFLTVRKLHSLPAPMTAYYPTIYSLITFSLYTFIYSINIYLNIYQLRGPWCFGRFWNEEMKWEDVCHLQRANDGCHLV